MNGTLIEKLEAEARSYEFADPRRGAIESAIAIVRQHVAAKAAEQPVDYTPDSISSVYTLGRIGEGPAVDAALRMIDSRFCEAYSDAVLLFDERRGEIEAMHGAFADLLRLCRETRPERVAGGEAEAILGLFMDAQTAFDHGDDVRHMLCFGEATTRLQAYFRQKANPTRIEGENP